MKKSILVFALALLTFIKNYAQNDKAIYSIIDANAQQLAQKSGAYSVSIGILKDGKTYTKHFGEVDKGKRNKANDDTYFEIASVTKLFTGQLLAKAVLDGKISLEDDIRKYLKNDYPNLEYNGTPIKIKNVISYTTALPRTLPDDEKLYQNLTDETPFLINKLAADYSKEQFFKDLKNVKLDTIPGTKYKYSNLSLELTGVILENIYGKSIETIFDENIFSGLGMKHTKFTLDKNESLANGYCCGNHRLMPHFNSNLWSSTGAKTKSSLGDLMKFMKEELNPQNKIAQESQKNIEGSKEKWHGYFWDDYYVTEKGKSGFKHGGAYGTQTMFMIYPELNAGICMIINISNPETLGILHSTATNLIEDLTNTSDKKQVYGYSVRGNNAVFSYAHPEKMDSKLIHSVSVAGSFNDWNPGNKEYQMKKKGENLFELEVPLIKFEKGKIYSFKFVLNKESWMTTPKNASNIDGTEDNNLVFML
ncbi:serine hydrolase [Chryseobacterium sp.]|uniref:serine hydrolase n=1 Tax=Chryseobacterium sp. TaxID=1871047 RepID=UPI0026215FC8|nr:serine hydrolase [Chryseobacterium sp.]